MSGPKTTILYVIENESFGGGERAFAQLINGLDKSRYEVYAACLTGQLNPASATFTGEITGAAKILSLDLRRLVSLSAFFSLKKIIRENNIRIIHSQGARADFYARLAARAAGGGAIVSTIASPVEEYNVSLPRKAVYNALDRLTGCSVDRFIAVADHIGRKLVLGRGIPAHKVVRIYNGIEPTQYAPQPDTAAKARADYNIPPNSFLAGTFCRLSWEKGLFHLIEAAKIIAGRGDVTPDGIKYLIAGEGPLEKELKAKVKSLGLENSFVFAGFIKDVRPLLSALDIFVLPSFREGFPVSVLEAMAMGKPVAASNIDGINESVADGLNGLLVSPKDSAALAGAITALFKDKARAAEMGHRGRAIVADRFGLDKMIKAHEDLYERLLNL